MAVCATAIGSAPALSDPWRYHFTPSGIVAGQFGQIDVKSESEKVGHWGMILKTKDDTDVGADRLTVDAGGLQRLAFPSFRCLRDRHRGQRSRGPTGPIRFARHTPTIRAIRSSSRPIHVHNVTAAGGAEFIAIHINPTGTSGPAFRVNEDEPTNCH